MLGKLSFILGFLFCTFILFPIVGIALSSCIITSLHSDITCDDESLLSVSTWLYINAGALIIFIVLMTICIIFYAMDDRQRDRLTKFLKVSTILLFMALIFWNIFGSIILFKYSYDCRIEEESIYIIAVLNLVIVWLMIPFLLGGLVVCCSFGIMVTDFIKNF